MYIYMYIYTFRQTHSFIFIYLLVSFIWILMEDILIVCSNLAWRLMFKKYFCSLLCFAWWRQRNDRTLKHGLVLYDLMYIICITHIHTHTHTHIYIYIYIYDIRYTIYDIYYLILVIFDYFYRVLKGILMLNCYDVFYLFVPSYPGLLYLYVAGLYLPVLR